MAETSGRGIGLGTNSGTREKALEVVATAREGLTKGADKVRDFIVNKPIPALGLAVALGVTLGWLIKRR